jgi:pimeloyl-ACP methyl ester carboxylesterase
MAISTQLTSRGLRKLKADFDVVIMKHMGHYPMLERPEEFDRHVADVVRALHS